MKPLERRRKTDRERLKRWRQKKLADGNKQIQLMLTPEAQKILIREKKRTGEPYVHIINQAIIHLGKGGSRNLNTSGERSSEQQKIIHRVRQLWSEGYTYAKIANIFNNEGLPMHKDSGKWQASAVLDLDRKG